MRLPISVIETLVTALTCSEIHREVSGVVDIRPLQTQKR